MCAECERIEESFGKGSTVATMTRVHLHPKRRTEPYWTHKSWFEFCVWMQGRTIKAESRGEEAGETLLMFDDGSAAIVASNYEHDYSDETPGQGIQMPSVKVHEVSR